jgi:K+-transporting ATPase ATPase C chain
MKTTLRSIRIYIVLTSLTGIIYPVAMTGVAQLLFPKQANGSRIIEDGTFCNSTGNSTDFIRPRLLA